MNVDIEGVARTVRASWPSPLNLPLLIQSLDVALIIRPRVRRDVEGSYNLILDSPTITLFRQTDADALTARETFTLAHELGHHVLGHKGVNESPSRQYEKKCDAFAAALLISVEDLTPARKAPTPEELLNAWWHISQRTRTSAEVAARRIVQARPDARLAFKEMRGSSWRSFGAYPDMRGASSIIVRGGRKWFAQTSNLVRSEAEKQP